MPKSSVFVPPIIYATESPTRESMKQSPVILVVVLIV